VIFGGVGSALITVGPFELMHPDELS